MMNCAEKCGWLRKLQKTAVRRLGFWIRLKQINTFDDGFFTKKAERRPVLEGGGETVHVCKCWKIGCGAYSQPVVCLLSHVGWQILGLSFGIADELINTWDCIKGVAYGI